MTNDIKITLSIILFFALEIIGYLNGLSVLALITTGFLLMYSVAKIAMILDKPMTVRYLNIQYF